MLSLNNTAKQYYNEPEAARMLRITVRELHEILDHHVFTAQNPRPRSIELTYSDLLLLSVWAEPRRRNNVVEMPHRN